ncbi:MAG: Hsp20/alpha crystallin family protein [Eubacterium sp.]|nr:Hsp20/alpha crystallin family protein [Eubacterium sp.]
MYYPTLFTDNFVEDLLDGIFKYPYDVKTKAEAHPFTGRMITDIKEFDDRYHLDMELPGFTKDDVKVELSNGYLVVSAERAENNDENENDGKFIRKERYYGKMSRRFYVGKELKKEDIKAKFDNGMLMLDVPKTPEKPAEPETDIIDIE